MAEELDAQRLAFLQRAVDLSAKVESGELPGAPYTAVVVKDGKVVGKQYVLGKFLTHPYGKSFIFQQY